MSKMGGQNLAVASRSCALARGNPAQSAWLRLALWFAAVGLSACTSSRGEGLADSTEQDQGIHAERLEPKELRLLRIVVGVQARGNRGSRRDQYPWTLTFRRDGRWRIDQGRWPERRVQSGKLAASEVERVFALPALRELSGMQPVEFGPGVAHGRVMSIDLYTSSTARSYNVGSLGAVELFTPDDSPRALAILEAFDGVLTTGVLEQMVALRLESGVQQLEQYRKREK